MQQHKGWTEPKLGEALRRATPRVQSILAFVAAHPGCTSQDIADGLNLRSRRSVGPTLNALTRIAEELDVLEPTARGDGSSKIRHAAATKSDTTFQDGFAQSSSTSSANPDPQTQPVRD